MLIAPYNKIFSFEEYKQKPITRAVVKMDEDALDATAFWDENMSVEHLATFYSYLNSMRGKNVSAYMKAQQVDVTCTHGTTKTYFITDVAEDKSFPRVQDTFEKDYLFNFKQLFPSTSTFALTLRFSHFQSPFLLSGSTQDDTSLLGTIYSDGPYSLFAKGSIDVSHMDRISDQIMANLNKPYRGLDKLDGLKLLDMEVKF